ncbi:YvrJ family protein [Oceanobacillus luteolus]|uniref:YvrJ family protein n=1 Tax=Oceanobacillus luteolus TaxID=1274358 RepID=A0ABW4HX38_9BACI|nr:YvrJ family protein [Oceanobacillus luteolus]MCM3739778.1 YvrJ family protein [Oceanobacillus luteolus]
MAEFYTLTSLIPLLENVGFPLVVTLILLIRYEVRMERLEKHSRDLTDTINKLRRDIS